MKSPSPRGSEPLDCLCDLMPQLPDILLANGEVLLRGGEWSDGIFDVDDRGRVQLLVAPAIVHQRVVELCDGKARDRSSSTSSAQCCHVLVDGRTVSAWTPDVVADKETVLVAVFRAVPPPPAAGPSQEVPASKLAVPPILVPKERLSTAAALQGPLAEMRSRRRAVTTDGPADAAALRVDEVLSLLVVFSSRIVLDDGRAVLAELKEADMSRREAAVAAESAVAIFTEEKRAATLDSLKRHGAQLLEMGFAEDDCVAALLQARGNVEVAATLLLGGATQPLTYTEAQLEQYCRLNRIGESDGPQGTGAGADRTDPIQALVRMGFPRAKARRALRVSSDQVPVAADLLMNEKELEKLEKIRGAGANAWLFKFGEAVAADATIVPDVAAHFVQLCVHHDTVTLLHRMAADAELCRVGTAVLRLGGTVEGPPAPSR